MKRAHMLAGAVLFLFAAYIARDALRLSYYTSLGPGPGFFPFWLAVLLAIASLALIVQAARSGGGPLPAGFFPDRGGALRMGLIVAALVWVVLAMDWLGFPLALLTMYLAVLYGLGRRDVVLTLIVAVAGSAGVYYVFTRWLNVPLPAGILG